MKSYIVDIDKMDGICAIATVMNYFTHTDYQKISYEVHEFQSFVKNLSDEGYSMVSCQYGTNGIYYVDFAKGHGFFPRLLNKLENLADAIKLLKIAHNNLLKQSPKKILDIDYLMCDYFEGVDLDSWVFDVPEYLKNRHSTYQKVLYMSIANIDEQLFWQNMNDGRVLDVEKYRNLIKDIRFLTECVYKAILRGWDAKDIIRCHFYYDSRMAHRTLDDIYNEYSEKLADALNEIHYCNALSDNADADIRRMVKVYELADIQQRYDAENGLYESYTLTPRGILLRMSLCA